MGKGECCFCEKIILTLTVSHAKQRARLESVVSEAPVSPSPRHAEGAWAASPVAEEFVSRLILGVCFLNNSLSMCQSSCTWHLISNF